MSRPRIVAPSRRGLVLALSAPLFPLVQLAGCREDRPAPAVPTAPLDAGPAQELDSSVEPAGPIARDRDAASDGG